MKRMFWLVLPFVLVAQSGFAEPLFLGNDPDGQKQHQEARQLAQRIEAIAHHRHEPRNASSVPRFEDVLASLGINDTNATFADDPHPSVSHTSTDHGVSTSSATATDTAHQQPSTPSVQEVLCFPAETLISVTDNSTQGYHAQSIATVREGDFVVSCNLSEGGGSCELGRVQAVLQRPANRLIHLQFGGTELRATPEHPFYILEKKEWVKAEDLEIGFHFLNILGQSVELERKEEEKGEFTVYNLEVEGNHNYYACDVLVHNCTAGAAIGSIAYQTAQTVNPVYVAAATAVAVGAGKVGEVIVDALRDAVHDAREACIHHPQECAEHAHHYHGHHYVNPNAFSEATKTGGETQVEGGKTADSPMRPVNGESGAASDKSGTVDDTNVSDRGSKINPFKGKSFEQIDQELRDRGFVPKGKDPQSGKGSYMHPTTGRKYYLDKGGVYKKGTENPHVDVHYNRPVNGVEKQRLLLGDKLYDK